jgi:hypothetical protein
MAPDTPPSLAGQLPQGMQFHGKWLFSRPFIEAAEHYQQT